MKEWNLNTAELRAHAKEIKVGEMVNLSGTIYTARDAAHKRLFAMLDEGKDLPFDVKDAVIYYAGPTQAKPGEVIGSIGPTTSGRMDPYAPRLLDMGLVAAGPNRWWMPSCAMALCISAPSAARALPSPAASKK